MFEKILPFWALLRKGQALADCSKSGDRAAISGAVVAVLVALLGVAAVFGYTIPLDSETLQAIGSLVASLVILWLNGWHVAANPAVGLPAVSPPDAASADERVRYPGHVPPRAMPPPPGSGNDRSTERIGDGKPTPPPDPPAVTNL